jgi:hypothetical protein
MSATRDNSQKFTFVYSNLYQIYRKGKQSGDPVKVIPLPLPNTPSDAVKGLRENLERLKSLHERLRHMLGELEELTKDHK